MDARKNNQTLENLILWLKECIAINNENIFVFSNIRAVADQYSASIGLKSQIDELIRDNKIVRRRAELLTFQVQSSISVIVCDDQIIDLENAGDEIGAMLVTCGKKASNILPMLEEMRQNFGEE